VRNKSRGIEEIMLKAIKQGAFDNLKGKGKPLKMENNPYVEPGWQLAYAMLKENGFAPAWVEDRQDIENQLTEARIALARTWKWMQSAAERGDPPELAAAEWAKAQKHFRDLVEEINTKIKAYNLKIPTDKVYRAVVDVEREVEKIRGEK
jgi:hypothetical protein